MSLFKALVGFAAKHGDDIVRAGSRYADDVVGQTNLFSKAGKARNFTNAGRAANLRPTVTPVTTRAQTEAAQAGMPRVVPVARRTPGQMDLPGTQQPFTGGPPPVKAVRTTPRPQQPQAPEPQFGPGASRMSQGPMQADIDPGTAQSIRQIADRASRSSGGQITPDMLTGKYGTDVLRNMDVSSLARSGGGGALRQAAPTALRRSGPIQRAGVDDIIDATIEPVSVRIIDRGGMPTVRMGTQNARNAARGLQVGDLSGVSDMMTGSAMSPAQRAMAEKMTAAALVTAGAGLGLAGAEGYRQFTNNPESKGAPDSLSNSQVPLSEPTVSTGMGQSTATVEEGPVADPQRADNPIMQPLVDSEVASTVAQGMDTGPTQLEPVPEYRGPQPGAPIVTRGDMGEQARSQKQQGEPTGLAKYYAERAQVAMSPGVNEATIAELQGMGILNTPDLAMWAKSNPALAYDLLEKTKASRPTMPSQQSINLTGTQLMSSMGSDVDRNAIGNTMGKDMTGTAYGADMSAATRAYSAPVIRPVGRNAMYDLQGRVSY